MDQRCDFVFTLLSVANRLERRFDGQLSNVMGISFSEYQLLKQLGCCEADRATRAQLAAATHSSPSAISRALKPLEKIGLVTCDRREKDVRQRIATLTAAGRTLLEDAQRLLEDEIALLKIPEHVFIERLEAVQTLMSLFHREDQPAGTPGSDRQSRTRNEGTQP